jgi:phosphoglycolate phosphatase-like HAD superfamily hydrolase
VRCKKRQVSLKDRCNIVCALRVLILDFDGVVIESNDVKTEAFKQVFARFPEHIDEMMAFHHANVSVTRFAKFDYLLSLLGRPDDSVLREDIALDFSRRVQEMMMTVSLVPGAEVFLKKLRSRMPLYLASVTPDSELETILERRGLASWFKGVYGCPPWTKPGAVRDALAREGAAPGDALLIGDSAGDQRAAQMTGVGFLARNSGLKFDEPSPLIFADLNEILNYVEGMFV